MMALFSIPFDSLHFLNMFIAKETINPLDGGGVTYKMSVSVSLIGIDSFIWILFLWGKCVSLIRCYKLKLINLPVQLQVPFRNHAAHIS